MMLRKRSNEAATVIGPYRRLGLLGQGAFGQVFTAQHTKTNCLVALKIIPKSTFKSPEQASLLHREVNLMLSADHPFVATIYELLQDEKFWYISMEYLENGNLSTHMKDNNLMDEHRARRLFDEIISALFYLHRDKHIIHRDLKPENILLDHNFHIRLIDFGLANSFTDSKPYCETICGSPVYCSPELLLSQPYTAATDIWASGILLYLMVVGVHPFRGENVTQLLRNITDSDPILPDSISDDLKDLLMRLLAKDPHERCTIPQILTHPWMAEMTERRLQLHDDGAIQKIKIHEGLKELDEKTVDELFLAGYEKEGLLEEIAGGVMNERTAAYKMIRRRDAVTELHNWCIYRDGKPTTPGLLTGRRCESSKVLHSRLTGNGPARRAKEHAVACPKRMVPLARPIAKTFDSSAVEEVA
jgi:serine/threonine protein kinase